jgi:hypothetical protein
MLDAGFVGTGFGVILREETRESNIRDKGEGMLCRAGVEKQGSCSSVMRLRSSCGASPAMVAAIDKGELHAPEGKSVVEGEANC